MLPRAASLCAVVVSLALVAACGSNGPSGIGSGGITGGNGSFTATIDGKGWAATSNTISVTVSNNAPGGVVIFGTQISGNNTTTLSFTLGYITGTGTYPLGVSFVTTPGGVGSVETATISPFAGSDWITPTSGAAGQFVITTLTSTRIAGTFQFTAGPALANAGTGTKTVTNGKFDLTLPAAFTPATSPGSTMSATFGSLGSFAAATVTGENLGTTAFEVLALNDSISVSLSTSFAVSANTSYPFAGPGNPSGAIISVSVTSGSTTWGDSLTDSGTVTMTTVTPTRVSGTFSGTLAGSPPLTITNGKFSFIPVR